MEDMQELQKQLEALKEEFLKVYQKLQISDKLSKLAELEKEVADPDIWKDVEAATAKNQELAKLQDETQPWELLKTQINDLNELIENLFDNLCLNYYYFHLYLILNFYH